MIYPKFISKSDIIGVSAPSDGITDIGKVKRLDYALKNLADKGYKVVETKSVRKSIKGRSTESINQAKELESLYLDKDINAIICAAGGDFLIEILPFINYDIIKDNIKWLQGYSDPTGLLYTITTRLDIATIYGSNFCEFGMNPWHKSLENNLKILEGNVIEQNSFDKYESSHTKYINGDETYTLDKKVLWENLNDEKEINITGRIIGGCIDILSEIFGTKFDYTKDFLEKYQEDGIIWYFDNCEFSSEGLIRILWKMQNMDYFKYCKGIIFGRSATETSYYDISFKEAVKHSLEELQVPIIINADIGHVAPRMTIINGSIANIKSTNGKGSISFKLE